SAICNPKLVWLRPEAALSYAIAIMTDIAMQGEGITITGNDIARRQNISFSFVAQLLNKLKHAGLLESIRGGVSGGYHFKCSPAEVTIKKIVEAIEPSFCICPSIDIKTAQPVDDTVRAFWKRVGIDVSKWGSYVVQGSRLESDQP
ncbi:MAG: Rrf2 family transcriptional regulator, partial [bacterium]|nr:Rrf2 family transcriptional regulator [bacterium]